MTVGRGGQINGPFQVEHGNQTLGSQIKVFSDQQFDFLVRQFACAEGVDADGSGFGDADGIGNLNFTAVSQSGGNDILRHVTTCISGAAIDLGRILAGECAATMARHAAVSINDDLATGQSAVTDGAADDEFAGGIDMVLSAGM